MPVEMTPQTSPSIPAPDPISAELERALFKRFWTWLAIVGTLVFLMVSGLSVIASQLVSSLINDRVEAAIKSINGLETRSFDSIERIQQKSVDAAIVTAAAQSRSAAAAKAAEEATSDIQKRIGTAAEVEALLKGSDMLVAALSGNSAFIDRVTSAAEARIRQPPAVNNATKDRLLGSVYQNLSNRTRIVIVASTNLAPEYTMYASAASTATVPSSKTAGGNGTSMAAVSFYGEANHASSLTFVVPANWYYSVTTDGGSMNVAYWTEVDL